MARINLLPWREQQREERKKQFFIQLGTAFFASLILIILVGQYYSHAIDEQAARNQLLKGEIAKLDQRIAAISELKTRRKQLVERMRIIQDLQGNRPIIGRVFDQLTRTLPDGVYFTEVSMKGKELSISGVADSNNRVSELMRNLDGSPWLEAPSLAEVKAATEKEKVVEGNLFQLTVRQTEPPMPGAGK